MRLKPGAIVALAIAAPLLLVGVPVAYFVYQVMHRGERRAELLSNRTEACKAVEGFPGLVETLAETPIEIVEIDAERALLRSRNTGQTAEIRAIEWCVEPFFTRHQVAIDGTDLAEGVRFGYPRPNFAVPDWVVVPSTWRTRYLLISHEGDRGIVEVEIPGATKEEDLRAMFEQLVVLKWSAVKHEGDWLVAPDGLRRMKIEFTGKKGNWRQADLTFRRR